MDIAILGCGSIGGVIAGKLVTESPHKIWIINRNLLIRRMIEDEGLHLKQDKKSVVSYPELIETPDQLPVPVDVVILTTKCNNLLDSARVLTRHLKGEGFFITTQNGMIALDLIDHFGSNRVVPGCVMWGASMPSPGRYEVTAEGHFIIGDIDGRMTRQVKQAEEILKYVFPVKLSEDITASLWAKLSIVAALTPLGCISGINFGEMLNDRQTRKIVLRISGEVAEVARSLGNDLTVQGDIAGIKWILKDKHVPKWLKHVLVLISGLKHKRTQSSMLASVLRGRKTEIEYLNGLVIRLGKMNGVDTPFNNRIVEAVKKIESDLLKPDIKNLFLFDELFETG